MSNRQTVKPSNRQTVKPSNRQTVKPSNRQTVKLKTYLFLIISLSFVKITSAQFECAVLGGATSPRIVDCSQFDLTTDEILCLPEVTFSLAFHFQEDQNGNNFICDPMHPLIYNQPWTSQYAPNLVDLIINHMNSQMSNALLYNGQELDSRINFKLYGNGDCGSALFTYSQGGQPTYVPGALNVNFRTNDVNSTTIGGRTNFGADWMIMDNIINDWVYGQKLKRFWVVANTMLHEFGHTRNLNHSYYCGNVCHNVDLDVNAECNGVGVCVSNPFNQGSGCGGSSPQNLVMGVGGNPSNLTECEFGELWNYIINNDVSFQDFETCDLPPNNNDRITYDDNSSIVWDSKKIFTKHVTIKSGTTITINCEVLMGDDKEILVEEGAKLIVDGGTISSICEKPWRGIKVVGGDNGFVEIKGGATINNTSQGAVSMFHDGGWLLGNGNAHVKIEGSTFNDCNRMLGMGSVANNINLSTVRGNIQIGGKYGITNWNCLNVIVENNHFEVSDAGIVTDQGQFFIREENTFESGVDDIFFASISPSLASFIVNNDFDDNGTGIRMLGTSIAQHEITSNRFNSNQFNLYMDGDNHYKVDENSLKGTTAGGVFINNGNHNNSVTSNNISFNDFGLVMNGENKGFVSNSNCFETFSFDNLIFGQIGNIQGALSTNGASLNPANNCFTHLGSGASPVVDMWGNPSPFLYIEPEDDFNDCRDAVQAHSNISILELNKARKSECSNETPSGIEDPCNPRRDLNEINQSLIQLENQAAASSFPTRDVIQSCYENVRSLWVEVMLEQNNFDEVRSFLNESNTDDAKLLIYKSYLLENQIEQGKQYLQSLSNNSEQLDDFIYIQLVQTKRLLSNFSYQVSSSELAEINHIALKDHPYAAYGKSLYYWITGEILSSEFPKINDEIETQGRSTSIANESEKLNMEVYPNPFSNQLIIDFGGELEKKSKIIIDDIQGKNILVLESSEHFLNISTDTWSQGMYIISIYDEGELIHSEKLVLLR